VLHNLFLDIFGFLSVVWIPDSHLLTLDSSDVAEKPDQTLHTMEEFVPEEWGLPPYEEK